MGLSGFVSMTCRELAPPVGLIAFLELMKDLHSLLRSGLRSCRPTMPSADFCLSPECYHAGRFRIPDDHAHHSHLTHDRQISPDSVQYPLEGYKNVNLPCTTAAFTLSPEPVGFVMSCQLTRRLGLPMRFLSVGPHFCTPASSGPILADTPLPSARTFGSIPHMSGHPWFPYRGLSPHKFTPMPGVHKSNPADRYAPADFFVG